jgi:ATP-dependent Clp protease ATP-binding subunit ClpB
MEESYGALKSGLITLMREKLRPEFLNRIDEIIMFNPLKLSHIREIVDMQIKHLQGMMEKNNIFLEVREEVRKWLAAVGCDINYGARPLKRTIQRYLTNPLAQKIISKQFVPGTKFIVYQNEKGLVSFKEVNFLSGNTKF